MEALTDAGIAADQVQSESLTMGREETLPGSEARSAAKPKYTADQQWRVHVSAGDARKIAAIAVEATVIYAIAQDAPAHP